jgi:hypothetical protein
VHRLKKSVVVPCSAARMFGLVADVERYQEFLPWCTGSRIIERQDGEVVAEIHVGHGAVSTSFATRNRNHPMSLSRWSLLMGLSRPSEVSGASRRFRRGAAGRPWNWSSTSLGASWEPFLTLSLRRPWRLSRSPSKSGACMQDRQRTEKTLPQRLG